MGGPEPEEAPSPYATAKIHHDIDPKGDTILVLRPSKASFAVWMQDNEWPNALDQSEKQSGEAPGQPSAEAGQTSTEEDTSDIQDPAGDQEEKEPVEVLFRVSSRHLALASDYFQALFEGPWKESGISSFTSPRILIVDEWREKPFLILMDVFHGRSRRVPRQINLELAAQLSVLVDYYQCYEVVDLYAEWWLSFLQLTSVTYDRDLILRLSVAWVFSKKEVQAKLHKILQENSQLKVLRKIYVIISSQCRGPIQTLGLPIPLSIVDSLDFIRQKCVGGLFDSVYTNMKRLTGTDSICKGVDHRELCTQAMLGSLIKILISGGLLFEQPKQPYYGYSWGEVSALVKAIPSIDAAHSNGRICSAQSMMKKDLRKLQEDIDLCIVGEKNVVAKMHGVPVTVSRRNVYSPADARNKV